MRQLQKNTSMSDELITGREKVVKLITKANQKAMLHLYQI
jgi:hypothetical protein